LPTGEAIPLGSRILAIAEAYDAMISDSVYRAAMDQEAVFAELRACAGNQFDPALVERFIAELSACDQSRRGAAMRTSREIVSGVVGVTENLARAVENRDAVATAAIARRLKAITAKDGSGRFSQIASQLERLALEDVDSLELTSLMGELLEMCRDTQRRCIGSQDRPDSKVLPPFVSAVTPDAEMAESS
jgi:hypothetical protein